MQASVRTVESVALLRVLCLGLFSDKYPAVGETHGLSVVAGAIEAAYPNGIDALKVLDLVTIGAEDDAAVIRAIDEIEPTVLAISVPYGTFEVLVRLKPALTRLLDHGTLVLVGGSLPTYVADQILTEVDDRLVVVIGEGDEAAPLAVAAWQGGYGMEGVPNTLTSVGGVHVAGPRRLAPISSVAAPHRGHLGPAIESGSQIFVEFSRACSWAVCSFCLRGLTDISGSSKEYRHLPLERLAADWAELRRGGVSAVTFADEDFLGNDVDAIRSLVDVLEAAQGTGPPIIFDVSATIRSIFDESDDPSVKLAKAQILADLRNVGLNKIFLGMESGSPSQLHRYVKGHTPAECVEAAATVLRSGARLEIGWIMFDPLCTPVEIEENVRFLLDNDLSQYVSGPTSELRLQVGSRYIRLLERKERELGRPLFGRSIDPNTLSFPVDYVDETVSQLVAAVRADNDTSHPLVYAIKGLTRFGSGRILGAHINTARGLLGTYREATLRALEQAARCRSSATYTAGAAGARHHLAIGFLELEADLGTEHPMLKRAMDAAKTIELTRSDNER